MTPSILAKREKKAEISKKHGYILPGAILACAAVALVIFTLWKPLITIGGAFIFGALYILNSYLPTLFPDVFIGNVGLELSPLLKMIPYVVTIVVLIVTSIRNKKENQAPAGLGLPYFREER